MPRRALCKEKLLRGFSRIGFCHYIPVFRTFQPQVFTQGGAFIFGTEQATALQFRHNKFNKVIQTCRGRRWQYIKAIRSFIFKPLLQLIDQPIKVQ